MTVAELSAAGRSSLVGISSLPALDSELLLATVLQTSREALIAHGTDAVSPRRAENFFSLVRDRRRGVPLPYLTGTKEFSGRTFVVTPAVLVPRPESEVVVAEAERVGAGIRNLVIADVGAGSGVLGISIAADIPRAHVVALDRAGPALAVARRNARRHKVLRRMTFLLSDLLNEIPTELSPRIIVANLPYVPSDDLQYAGLHPDTRGLLFEPPSALDGGPDGLYVVRRFFAQLRRRPRLRHNLRHCILEHAPSQRRQVLELAHRALPDMRENRVSPYVTSWTRF